MSRFNYFLWLTSTAKGPLAGLAGLISMSSGSYTWPPLRTCLVVQSLFGVLLVIALASGLFTFFVKLPTSWGLFGFLTRGLPLYIYGISIKVKLSKGSVTLCPLQVYCQHLRFLVTLIYLLSIISWITHTIKSRYYLIFTVIFILNSLNILLNSNLHNIPSGVRRDGGDHRGLLSPVRS